MNGSQGLAYWVSLLPIDVPKADDLICPIPKGCEIQDLIINIKRVHNEADKKRVLLSMVKYLKNSLDLTKMIFYILLLSIVSRRKV